MYRLRTKMYKCKMKNGETAVVHEEHLDFLKEDIIEKEFIGKLLVFNTPSYEGFYSD